MTKRDKIPDSGDEFKFEDQKEKALAKKYFKQPKPLPEWQIDKLIQIHRAVKKGILKFEELEEDLQKAIKEADPLFLEAIKTEFPEFEIPNQQETDKGDYDQDILYSIISDKIEKEHITSFEDLPPDLQEDIENGITTDILSHLKEKFPFFKWPADILLRKVDNYTEIIKKTADAYVSEMAGGIPIRFVKWDLETGDLIEYKAKIVENDVGKRYHWKLAELNKKLEYSKKLGGPNLFNFEIFEDTITKKYQVLDKRTKKIYDIEDYIREQGGQTNSADFIRMMKPPFVKPAPIPPKLEIYYNPETKKHFIPNEFYWRGDTEAKLISWFKYDPQSINPQIVNEEINTIWQSLSSEQRIDFLADFSFPLFNILNETANLEDGKIYILSYGTTGSGKTFIHRLAMRFFWGFDLSKGYFAGDWIRSSKFRLEVILSSTNLPIFVDEVSILSEDVVQDIKASTGGSVSGRGQGNLEVKEYPARTTLIMTAQHNVFRDFNVVDERALTRRFFVNYYGEKVIPNNKTKYLLDNLKTRGYAIHILQNRTIDELVDLYKQIAEEINDNRILATLIWGAKILDLTPEQLMEVNLNMTEDTLEDLTNLFFDVWDRIEEAYSKSNSESNSESSTIKPDFITTRLFGNIIKKDRDKDNKPLDVPYLAINSNFINLINSMNHPLRGKFSSLSELNELEKCFPKEVIEKLPGGRIFANYPVRFGKRLSKAACIPYIELNSEKAEAKKFAKTLSETYAKLFYPQAVQQPQSPQPQDQPQQEHQQEQQQKQDQQKPQEQGDPIKELVEKEKERERKREELLDDFKSNNNELELGAHFEIISDEDKKAILEAMYRNGEIMPIPGTGKWKYRL